MKKFKLSLAYLAVFAMIFTSCSKEETSMDTEDNSVMLTFGAMLNDLENRASNKAHFDAIPTCTDATPSYAEIELSVDGIPRPTITVDILSDADGLFTAYSEDLKIQVNSEDGVDISVTSFMVFADGMEEAIWVAPTGGSFAAYVNNPLPLNFNLQKGTKPYIDIEVLCFDRRQVNEYGYPFFDLIPTVVYPLCFFANYCPSPDGRHYVADYTLDIWYNDGENNIQIYNDEGPADTGITAGNYFARPACIVVPGRPDGFGPDDDYIFYQVTPKDWMGNYNDIDNTPLSVVGLSWNDINGLLNDDGETSEYLHLFIGCDDDGNGGPGGDDCPITAGDTDGDCVPNDDDICPGSDDRLDADGDGHPDGCDNCPNVANPDQNAAACADMPGDDCETAYMFGNHELSGSNWGWGLDFDQNGSWDDTYWVASGGYYEFPLWAAAAHNETFRGRLDGVVRVTLDGMNVHVQIIPDDDLDVTIYESHIFFGEGDWPTNRAPGQLGNTYNMSESLESHTFGYSGDGTFKLIVHAVTCR